MGQTDPHVRNLTLVLAALGFIMIMVNSAAVGAGSALSPPAQYGPAVALVGSQSCPSGIAVDSAGTVYWANRCSGQLLRFPRGASFPSEILSGLNSPYGVGVDAAGNVYFDEYFGGTLSRLTAGSNNPQIVLTGLNHPNYMSVDAAGDVYLITGQTCGDNIIRYDAKSQRVATLLTIAQHNDTNHGFGGLFIDGSGDLYYTTCDLGIDVLRSGQSSPSTLLNTTGRSTGIAVDKNGDVYYALYNSSVNELAAGSNTPLLLTGQGSSRLQLTIDPAGDLYFTDDVGGRIWEIPLQNPVYPLVSVSTTISTATSTVLTTSMLPSTVILTSISSNTQTVSVVSTQTVSAVSTQTVSVVPPTVTVTSISSVTPTTTQPSAISGEPTTRTVTRAISQVLTTSVSQTTTLTSVLMQYANTSPFNSTVLIGVVIAFAILAAYVVLSRRKRTTTTPAPQPPVDREPLVDHGAIMAVDGMVMKYVSDHGGKISISVACSDLGIPEPQLRESLKRLVDKGTLSK